MSKEGYADFGNEILEDDGVKTLLSSQQYDKISEIFKSHRDYFPSSSEKNLVHADFDPANILVVNDNGEWKISGVLDWEFSFSGSTLCDVANMLRYAHLMPKEYEAAFLMGLTTAGFSLPKHWQVSVNLLNLVSLLDCLKRADPDNRPNQISDIRELIDYIISGFKE